MSKIKKQKLKEGDPCNQPDCGGIMVYWSAEVCPCNTEAVPCKQCAEIPLECVRCGYSEENKKEPRLATENDWFYNLYNKFFGPTVFETKRK